MRDPINPGDKLDHYRIDSVAARSRTSTIFRAIDLRNTVHVAIKVPHPEMDSDPIFFERFHREEEIEKSFNHPGLLKFVEAHERSQIYMVTEWFEGQRLRQILDDEHKLSPERAIRIVLAICGALSYIHNHGVVHRALKPENIMVDAQGHIKLMNFGTAGLTGARRITFTKLTQVVGMSEYISPEELNGKRADARSDIYSVGVILYEMLTRRTPFAGTDPFERVLRHPTPPREIDPAISPHLQEVIYRALERQPQNRYANAHDFAMDLQNLNRVGIIDRPELKDWKKRSSARSKQVLFYAGLGLLPLIVFGLLLYFAKSP